MFSVYANALRDGFEAYGISLAEPNGGDIIGYSNRKRPTLDFQMWDANKKIDYIRSFFSYNSAEWEEAYLYETVRLIRQTKEALDKRTMAAPPRLEGMAARFQLQDIVILYSTLEPALSQETRALASPLVEQIKTRFAQGMSDEEEMRGLNAQAFESGLIYGYEEAVREDFAREGLDIDKLEEWPVEKINRVPQSLKAKLIPPLRGLFKQFRQNLAKPQIGASHEKPPA
jgi:hypothetical protein